MTRRKKVGIGVASVLIVALVVQLIVSLTGGGIANAEQVSVPFNYSSGVIKTGSGSFSTKSSAPASASYTVPKGYKIVEASYFDHASGKTVKLPLSSTGGGGWSGTIKGKAIQVKSSNNQNQGWYAWDRYGGSASNIWKAQGSGACPTGPLSQSSGGCLVGSSPVEYEVVDGYRVPKYPGVIDTNIRFHNKITNSYFTELSDVSGENGLQIDASAVVTPKAGDINVDKDTKSYIDIQMNSTWTIHKRMNSAVPVRDIKVANVTDSLYYDITLTTEFSVVDIKQDWTAPAAQMMVYLYAFNSYAESVTYRYPANVTYTIAPDVQTTPPTSSPTGGSTPAPAGITGDFDVLPSDTINYRDSVTLQPKDIKETGGCTYRYHVFKLSNGTTWTSPMQNSKTQPLRFIYPDSYPSPISAGTVTIQMKVYGTQCSSDWITKTLTVKAPANNHPPYFKLGWFRDGDFTSTVPLTKVVQGTKVMVRPIEDANSTPVSPSDPDGDPFSLTGWDYSRSNSWVASLPDTYGFDPLANYLDRIDTTVTGYHTIYATMKDSLGASYTAGASLEVIPPNPIPLIDGPDTVKENRPVAADAFSSARSYSPVGRNINHSKDEWTNKQTAYTNGTDHDLQTTVKLDVWDDGNPALKSLAPATHTLTIKPDLPPFAKLGVPSLGLRGMSIPIINKSYSPDGDAIVSADYKYKYDALNNGFDDDAWVALSGTLQQTSLTPAKVGKYLFYVKVKEDYGKEGDTSATQASTLTLDIINLAPTVSFVVEGKNEQPVPPVNKDYTPASIANWTLLQTNSNSRALLNSWNPSGNQLIGGSGKNSERQYPNEVEKTISNYTNTYNWFNNFEDAGYGTNNINPYRTMTSARFWKCEITFLFQKNIWTPRKTAGKVRGKPYLI